MAVINMAGLLPASWAADRLGRTRIILPGMSLMGTALILASMTTSPGLFTACMALYALGQTINGSAPTAFAMDIMPEKSRGAALGIYRCVLPALNATELVPPMCVARHGTRLRALTPAARALHCVAHGTF